MTNRSIAAIKQLLSNGDLFVHSCEFPAKRGLFITQAAQKDLSESGAIGILGHSERVEAAFTIWVSGKKIHSEGNGKPGFIKRLDHPPAEIWEIRVSAPTAKIRAFGRFVLPNFFVVIRIFSRDYLGPYNSQAWEEAGNECAQEWEALFADQQPFSGSSYDCYIEENCDEFRLGIEKKTRIQKSRNLRSRTRKK